MRYLTFDSTDQNSIDHYEIMLAGLNGTMRGLDRAEARVMSRVLDKFEALGKPVDTPNGATIALTKSGTVELEDAEYKFVTECFDSTRWKTGVARRVTKAMDWFEAAPAHPDVAQAVT